MELIISCVVMATVGALVLQGWELNVLESMTISLAVGLSIDYVIHLGVAFKMTSRCAPWRSRVCETLARVGSAVTMAALTTFLTGGCHD
jgi:predicted RND superfamily exporter protein